MTTKICSTCKKTKDKKEFSKNKNNVEDNLSTICKECSAKYQAQYREKQIEKYGKERFLEIQWEKKLRKKAEKNGIPLFGVDINKIKNLRFTIIDYPDKSFPYSLSHTDFMLKYELTVDEYLFIREKVVNNNTRVYNENRGNSQNN